MFRLTHDPRTRANNYDGSPELPYSAMALATSSVESLPPSPRRVRPIGGHVVDPNVARFNVGLSAGIIANGFGDVEGRIFAAHVVSAHLAFRDDTSNGRFKARGHF